MSHGHDWRAVTKEYPADLVRLFYSAAAKRVARERAGDRLTLLRMVRLAYASVKDERSLANYRQVVSALEREVEQAEPPSQAEAIERLKGRLAKVARKP